MFHKLASWSIAAVGALLVFAPPGITQSINDVPRIHPAGVETAYQQNSGNQPAAQHLAERNDGIHRRVVRGACTAERVHALPQFAGKRVESTLGILGWQAEGLRQGDVAGNQLGYGLQSAQAGGVGRADVDDEVVGVGAEPLGACDVVGDGVLGRGDFGLADVDADQPVAFAGESRRGRKDGYDTNMTGRAGQMGSRLQYLGVIGQYRKMMEDSIARESVPRDYHDQIKDYFQALDER